MKINHTIILIVIISIFGACTMPSSGSSTPNSFFSESSLYLKYPPFDKIKNEHYAPAFELGMKQHMQEIDSIALDQDLASFENTILAMEKAGSLLDRVSTVFYAMTSAHTNDEMEKVRSEMAPKLSAHSDKILLNDALFQRVNSLYDNRMDLGLDNESVRLIEKYHTSFIRAGAKLNAEQKERLKAINSEIAVLQTNFSQNVLKEVNALAIVVDSKEKLEGLSESAIESASNEAKSRGMEGKYVIALKNTSGQPSLSSLKNRELRKRIHTTSLSRGSRGGEFDNREILTNVLRLRAEKAKLLGYENHAAYTLEVQTAQTPQAVNERLGSLAPKSLANAKREASDLQEMINASGESFSLSSWDWDYYTEKVRAERYSFDASQLKPYFEMDNVLQNGVFFAANHD